MVRRLLDVMVLLCVMVLAGACGAPQPGAAGVATGRRAALNVFAAASLTDAFREIGTNFEQANPGTTITFNFAGSQQLIQQIVQGAPADVFAAANSKQMDAAVEAGSVAGDMQQIFAHNRLVVIFPKDNPAGLRELNDLARPGVKLDLAAKEVPAGQYALAFLDTAAADPAFGTAFKADTLKNVVSYEENVKAVLSKVVLGEADAGIVYVSDIAGDAAAKVGRLDIPDQLNTIADYPIAPINDSQHSAAAEQFVAYVLSPDAQAILAEHGFMAATDDAGDQ